VLILPRRQRRVRRARQPLLPSAAAKALQRPARRRRHSAGMYHGLKFDPSGKLHPDPGAGQTSRRNPRRARPLPDRRAPAPWSGSGRAIRRKAESGEDSWTSTTCPNPRWARASPIYMHYDASYLADRRQHLSDFAHPRLRAHQDPRRLGGVRLPVEAHGDRAGSRTAFRVERLAHGRGRARHFHKKGGAETPARSTGGNHRRACTWPGIFFMETLFSQAGSGAEKRQP